LSSWFVHKKQYRLEAVLFFVLGSRLELLTLRSSGECSTN